MKKIKLFKNNVLIKVDISNSSIIIPTNSSDEPKKMVEIKSIEVLEMGELVEDLAIGDKIMMDINPVELLRPVNFEVGAKEDAKEDNCSALYYMIKDFNIVARFTEKKDKDVR